MSRENSRAGGPRILITGATGHVGGELLTQLVARGLTVRAMTRRPEAIAPHPLVQVVRGDFTDDASLDAALSGIEAVFAMTAEPMFSAPEPTHDLALARAFRRAGVERVVKLSALGGGGADPNRPIARWVSASEAPITGGDIPWTLLRPGRFMSNVLGWAPMIKRGEVSVPLARRRTAALDPADVARVAALALTEPGHAQRPYELSGPESLSPVEEVAIASRILGRAVRLNALSGEAARAGMLRYGMPAHVVDAILADEDGEHGSEILPTVAQLTGQPPRRFEDWFLAHRTVFE
jgi:uncharacterized protein YbjT (DUF2867 family)